MDGQDTQSAFDELVEMERQYGPVPPDMPETVDTDIMRQPLVYEDPPEPTTRKVDEVTAAEDRLPLEPYQDNDGSTLRVSITYGTVGSGDLDSYGPVTITVTSYFFCKTTCDSSGALTNRELITQTSLSVTETDTVGYLYLGRAVVSGSAITSVDRNLSGSKTYQRCGYTGNYTHHYDPL